MGMALHTACHRCKIQVYHFRGEENLTIMRFYRKHRDCMKENASNVETLEDQYQETDWMDDYPKDEALEEYAKTHTTKVLEVTKNSLKTN